MSDEKPVPEQVRDAIEDSEWPELSIREVMERTGLSKQQVVTAGASMDRLEIDQSIGAVRLPEDDGGEFHDDASRELRTDGGTSENADHVGGGKHRKPLVAGSCSLNRCETEVLNFIRAAFYSREWRP